MRWHGCTPQVAGWLAAHVEADLYPSFSTFRTRHPAARREDSGFASDRRPWLDRTVTVVGDRILDFTATDARTLGELSERIGRPGADLMIAAQAHRRDGIVVTREGADFQKPGVRRVDPF